MRSLVQVVVYTALLAATAGVELTHRDINLYKCCDVNEMLSTEGKSCVEAHWPRNFSIKIDENGFVVPPLDSEWVRRWLPSGLAMESITEVDTNYMKQDPFSYFSYIAYVNASSLWDPALLEKEVLLHHTVAFLGKYTVARPKPGRGYREADYCVDAAPPPLGPFAVRFSTNCIDEECAYKCCWDGKSMRNINGTWKCENDAEGVWTPQKTSLTVFEPEFPHDEYSLYDCPKPRVLPFEERYAEWARHSRGFHHFHFSTWHTCFAFYRSSNGTLHEGLFVCEYPRITRGVYWLLRPLCFLSALLLTASLVSVECDKNMRQKIHGRCLASHAACLLAFNIGQTVYYLAMSDRLNEEEKYRIPEDLQTVCKSFALSMYFVLTSSWIWLTALCVNLASGFRVHMPRLNKGSGKRFLAISVFAWGLPAVLTITCSILFIQPERGNILAWYTPSLMETRTCYIESLFYSKDVAVNIELTPFMKSGTALFYYGPVCCLVLCNIGCLVVTLRKIQYLRRGNSVLRREEDQFPLGQRHTGGNDPPTAHTATGNGQTPQGRNRSGTTVDAKTIKLYIKVVLLSGGIELLTEVVMWCITHENFLISIGTSIKYFIQDRDLAYRAAGFVTDFFRAAVVTWLAAPEGGYLGLVMRILRRGKREKKSAGAGGAGRRKHNVA